MMRTLKVFILFNLFMVSIIAQAVSMMDGFTDPEDGMFDVSHWLAEKKGFFPVPVIITEPAVGYGAGAALVFLHDPLAGRVPNGETVAVAEAVLRWNFTPRWSVVGFGRAGRFTDISGAEPASNVYSRGFGFRYFIARRFGAHVGFDIAKGPEDTTFYL